MVGAVCTFTAGQYYQYQVSKLSIFKIKVWDYEAGSQQTLFLLREADQRERSGRGGGGVGGRPMRRPKAGLAVLANILL